MTLSTRNRLLAAAAAAALAFGAASAEAAPTTALALVMDGSGSIDAGEFTTQINSYVGALNAFFAANPVAFGQVAMGGWIFGANVANFFATQTINNAGDLASLTGAIAGLNPGRAGINTGSTAIGTAINTAAVALQAFEAATGPLKLLIDVTTDGQNNLGPAPGPVAAGLTPSPIDAVNCLGIGAGADCTWVGTAGTNFGIVNNFAELELALERKLTFEVIGVPEPMSLALFGMGLAGLGLIRRRLG